MNTFVSTSKGAGMRTVNGRTDRVVVVGAGLGGWPARCTWPAAAVR